MKETDNIIGSLYSSVVDKGNIKIKALVGEVR